MPTYDPSTKFARATVSVAPSPATSGTTLSVDVGAATPPELEPPFYALVKPAGVDETGANAETVLVTAAADGTRTGLVTIEVLQTGSPGQGSVLVDTTVQGGSGTNEQQSLTVQASSGTWLPGFKGVNGAAVAWNASDAAIAASLNGISKVSSYAAVDVIELVEGGPTTNAQQQLVVVASGGSFTLSLDGVTTAAIAWNASDATKQTRLEALSNVGAGNVSVTGGVVTFQADLATTPVSLLVADTTLLTGTGSVTVSGGVVTFGGGLVAGRDVELLTADTTNLIYASSGVNEQVLVHVSADAGTFTLTFGANTTSALNWNAAAVTVQTALRALASVGGANVNVSGDAGGPYTLEFVGTLAGTDVGAVTANAASLTLNTRDFVIDRAEKGSTARSIVVGDTVEAAIIPDWAVIDVTLAAGSVTNDWVIPGMAPNTIVNILVEPGALAQVTGLAGWALGRRVMLRLDAETNAGQGFMMGHNIPSSVEPNRFFLLDQTTTTIIGTNSQGVQIELIAASDSVGARYWYEVSRSMLAGQLIGTGTPHAGDVYLSHMGVRPDVVRVDDPRFGLAFLMGD